MLGFLWSFGASLNEVLLMRAFPRAGRGQREWRGSHR